MSGFDDFWRAIMGQESGGNYSAVNGRTGAMGAYQILPSNIGPWSKQYLGYAVTPSQFLSSPNLQDRLARAVLQSYYNQYGARGAASAWYSGSASNASNYRKFNANEPSIGEYVDQVVSRMGGDYGVVPTVLPGADNRTPQTDLAEVYKQAPDKVDALAGVDRQYGLGEVSMPGLDAATGGQGVQAAAGPASTVQTAVKDMPYTGGAAPAQNMPATPGIRGAFVEMAQQYLGQPYSWGNLDCSGLIQKAMTAVGVQFPRVSWDQIAAGQRTDLSKLQPGDLVGFGGGGHIAIWLGNGRILEAPRTGENVRVRTLGKGESAFGVSLNGIFK